MAKSRSSHPGDRGTAATRIKPGEGARGHAEDALALLLKVMKNAKASPQARIAAADAMLAHGGGAALRERAREHAQDALAVLRGVMKDPGATSRTRLAAARALLEFGHGEAKPHANALTAHDGGRWLNEIQAIREQFAAGRPATERSGRTSTPAGTARAEAASRRTE